MDERLMKQLMAELIDAQEQANAVICGALADALGEPFITALENRAASSQGAARHPIRDKLLATALRAVRAKG
jgi:hypothetical protein